jgi:hypothetical protein
MDDVICIDLPTDPGARACVALVAEAGVNIEYIYSWCPRSS